jgi:hypothetical protein
MILRCPETRPGLARTARTRDNVPARRPSGSVPVHFNAAADIDGQGGRLSLLAFPVIRREERCLARVFGEAYEAYAERVRRWW